jgi:hypothetical protein
MMRASFATLLVTTLVLSSTVADARPKKRPKKTPKKQPASEPAPAPEPTPQPTPAPEPADGTTTPPTSPPSPPSPPIVSAPPTKEAKAQAKALQKEATKYYNVQEYEKAAELYKQAYLLDPNPGYLYASAQSQRLGGDCTKALQSYQAYLRANPPESERAKANANIERCEQELREREAAVNADQISAPVDVPKPPPPPPAEPPPPPPPPPPGKSYVLGHLMLGVGLIGIGGGSYLFYTGRKALDEHNSAPTYDDYIAGLPDVDAAKQKQQIGVIAIGGGAALVGGAILYYVVHSRSSESPPPVRASVSAQSATLTFTGTF